MKILVTGGAGYVAEVSAANQKVEQLLNNTAKCCVLEMCVKRLKFQLR